ncbi:hypothetical protein Y1Q_0014577 [Alligator mississippiensis]|uniref:Uncharacterized protein n=1 Tax=Alligator mississippiensis TaxID=8496 RepID=A0A151PD89_ALLMI|nr:hypothetical protein Y1Q_0014577 [Alligator mississippiensis]
MVVWTLELAQSLYRLKMSPSKRYLIPIPRSLSWKASDSIEENTMLKRKDSNRNYLSCFGYKAVQRKLAKYVLQLEKFHFCALLV